MGATSLDLSQIKSDALSSASTFRTLIGLGSSATLNAGSANGVATLDALGKLAASQVPDISLISYLGSVASQAAMLALSGQQGDWCVRSDLSTTWVITGSDPTQIGNWTQLSYPSVPVQSVFGRTGNVVGVSTDYSSVGITNTAIGASNPSTGAFTTLSATCTLNQATGNEIATQINYTTNKATSGDDTGLKIGMTDTASPGTSKFLDIFRTSPNATTQSVFWITNAASSGTTNSWSELHCKGSIHVESVPTGYGLYLPNDAGNLMWCGNAIGITSQKIMMNGSLSLQWSSDSTAWYYGTLDLTLYRDAAGILAQRNGANQQRFNLYGTYSDGANYRRLYLDSTTAGAFKIGVEGAGSGASGNTLELNSSTTKLGSTANNPVTLDFNGGQALSCILNASALWALEFQGGGQTRLAFVAGGAASQLRFSRHGANSSMISWGGSDTNAIRNSTQDAGIYSPSPGIIEINSGTTGTLRDLSLRSLLPATGSVAVDTPILSATSTWNSNVSVTGASGTGTTATLTFSAMTTAFPVGSTIVVSSVNPSGYNGTFTVTASTTTSVSYANATTGAYVSGGNIKQLFTALKLNVTDTSSDAGSLLADFQVGGSSQFRVTKLGEIQVGGSSGPYLSNLSMGGAGRLRVTDHLNSTVLLGLTPGLLEIRSSAWFGWSPNPGQGSDLMLWRDAAHILALRSYNPSTNAQTFRLYRTASGSPGTDYERLALSSTTYSSAVYNTILCESGGTGAANINLVLGPKGTGAILAQVPDGTATGGNARGQYAVDLQMNRGAANAVASGNYSVIPGGQSNSCTGQFSFSGGTGTACSGDSSFAFGYQAYATNSHTVAITRQGGATGYMGCAIGGIFNLASGEYSLVGSGYSNTASGTCSVAVGYKTIANRMCQYSFGGGAFATNGDAQKVEIVLRKKTTDATPTSLMIGDDTQRLTIPSGKVFAFVAKISGIKSDGSAVAFYTRKGAIKNVGGTTSLVGSIETIGTDTEDNASTDVAITADDTNDALQINVTGIAAETWRWVAVVEGVEIGYGT